MIRLKNISVWAKDHKWQSWLIIAALYYLLTVSAIFLANAAFFAGLSLNLYWLFAIFGIATVLVGLYPLKNTTSYTFRNRKRADFALVTTGFLIVFSLFNTMITEYEPKPSTTNPYAVQSILKSNSLDFENESRLTKVRKRIKRRAYQRTQQFKAFWQTQNEIAQVLLILLILLVAVLLAFAIALLACSISCSGSTTGVTALLIFGWGGVLVGTIFGIRAVIRNGKKKKEKEESKKDSSSEAI